MMYITVHEHSDHGLLQLTDEDLLELPEEVLRVLSVKLLNDLKEARERLRQTSRNSSRPPSSDLPWDKTGADNEDIPPQQDEQTEVDNATPDTDETPQNPPKEQPQDQADKSGQAALEGDASNQPTESRQTTWGNGLWAEAKNSGDR